MKHIVVILQKSFLYSEKYSLLYYILSTFMDTKSGIFLKLTDNLQAKITTCDLKIIRCVYLCKRILTYFIIPMREIYHKD